MDSEGGKDKKLTANVAEICGSGKRVKVICQGDSDALSSSSSLSSKRLLTKHTYLNMPFRGRIGTKALRCLDCGADSRRKKRT